LAPFEAKYGEIVTDYFDALLGARCAALVDSL
jgi:hypothetical protein